MNARKVLCLLLAAGNAIYSRSMYARLPDIVPVHWNAAGQATGFAPKLVGVLISPCMAALMCFLTFVAPLLRARPMTAPQRAGFEILLLGVVVFLCMVNWGTLSFAAGQLVDISALIFIGLLGLFATVVYAAWVSTRPA